MTRFMTLCAVLIAFFFVTPLALAQPPAEDKVEEKADTKAADEKADTKADEKAAEGADTAVAAGDDGKAEPEAKADEKAAEGSEGTDDPTTAELVEDAKEIVAAAQAGEWALMVAGLIMLLLAAGRKYKLLTKVPANLVPWISMVLGVLAVVATELATGGEITAQRLMQGVLAGMAASGAWGMIGKHLPIVGGKKASKAEPAES